MFIASILAAAAMSAAAPESAPATTPTEAAPAPAAAPAQPAMHKVCYQYEVSGTTVPKRKCVMEPVKDAKADAPAKKDAPKSE